MTTADQRAEMIEYAKKGGFAGLTNTRRLIAHVEQLERECDALQAELEKGKGLLGRAKAEVHDGYCEGDEEGNWAHVPMCDELDTYLAKKGA